MTLTTEKKMTSAVVALTSREKEEMLFIWEVEKAARDLYTSLYEENNLTIFLDLMRSEQSQMDQIKAVIDQYGLAIPRRDKPGAFQNLLAGPESICAHTSPTCMIRESNMPPGTSIKPGSRRL